MSFSFEFIALKEHADQIVNEENAPIQVKDFLKKGLTAFKDGSYVRVKAVGHLYNNDYQRSNGELVVEQVSFRVPKVTS